MATGLLVYCAFWPLVKLGLVGSHVPDGIVSFREWMTDRIVLVWFLFTVPAIVMWVFARLARLSALGWPWVGLAACVLAFSVGTVKSGFPDPALHPTTIDGKQLAADTHVLTIGLPVFLPSPVISKLPQILWNWFTRDLRQTAQLLFPLIVAAVMLVRARQLSLCAEPRSISEC